MRIDASRISSSIRHLAFCRFLWLIVIQLGRSSSEEDPVCGKSAREVVAWLKTLQKVGELDESSPEVAFREEVKPLSRPGIHVLNDEDLQALSRAVKNPTRLAKANLEYGARSKVLYKLHDVWLFGNGLVANATHYFHLGALNIQACVESGLAMQVGRAKCAQTEWLDWIDGRQIDMQQSFSKSWKTSGMDLSKVNYTCMSAPSAMSLLDTRFQDFGHFHEKILPRLLWPALLQSQVNITLWRYPHERHGFLKAWLKLLDLRYEFSSLRTGRFDVDSPIDYMKDVCYLSSSGLRMCHAVKVQTLYLPLWIGLDDELIDDNELTQYTPQSDMVHVRNHLRKSLLHVPLPEMIRSAPTSVRFAIILERKISRSSSVNSRNQRLIASAEAAELRQTMLHHFGTRPETVVVSLVGTQGGFRMMLALPRKKNQKEIWFELSLADGLHLFSRAIVVVGIHGGLFHHLIVAPRGAHILELRTTDQNNLYFYHMCAALGFHYYFHPVKGKHNDVIVNLDVARLKRLLDMIAERLEATVDSAAVDDEL